MKQLNQSIHVDAPIEGSKPFRWTFLNSFCLDRLGIKSREAILFLSFYLVSTLLYYTTTWISWGAFKGGHPGYFHIEEFFASAGAQFIISFLVTLPILYITFYLLKERSLRIRILMHLFFLPIYVASCFLLLEKVTAFFGWSMYYVGYRSIWTIYLLFLFYVVQFALIHARGYFSRLQKEQAEKHELQQAYLQSELTALKAQLNPHFLHNLFNSINASIPRENERTRELIVQLSDLFRYQNYAAQQEWVTLEEELHFIQNYLELMQVRLKDRLTFSFEISDNLTQLSIVPMLLQPLVENAVNHGIATKITPSHLSIKIKYVGKKVQCMVSDTGSGISPEKQVFSKGLGLSNTRLIVQRIYQSDLTIEENQPCGTNVSFTL